MSAVAINRIIWLLMAGLAVVGPGCSVKRLAIRYAKRYEIPVIITNQVYMDTGKNTWYGLGGFALEHISKVIVRVEKMGTPGCRRARLVKHRSQPEGASFEFEIVKEGITAKI